MLLRLPWFYKIMHEPEDESKIVSVNSIIQSHKNLTYTYNYMDRHVRRCHVYHHSDPCRYSYSC
jgi:hypothetical protein